MVKDEIWGVSIQRVRAFFRAQADVTAENDDLFWMGSCRVTLTALPPTGSGIWAAPRTRLQMEGEEHLVQQLHHRFFIQFLSAGG